MGFYNYLVCCLNDPGAIPMGDVEDPTLKLEEQKNSQDKPNDEHSQQPATDSNQPQESIFRKENCSRH